MSTAQDMSVEPRDVGEARLVVPGGGETGESAHGWSGGGAAAQWVLIAAAVAALLGVVGTLSWLGTVGAARRMEARDPSEAAFRGLCKKLGISRPQRRVLRDSAAALRCEPVALLLSGSALERALTSATPSTLGALEIVRRRVSE